MTFRRGDSFDLYSGISSGGFPLSTRYTFGHDAGPAGSYGLITGRFGSGQALRISDTGNTANVVFANEGFRDAYQAFTFSAAVRRSAMDIINTGVGARILRFRTVLTVQLMIGVDFLGRVVVGRTDFAATLLGRSAAGVIRPGNWHTFDCEVEIDNSAGRVSIYVDGALVLNITGADTQTHATSNTVDNYDLCLETLSGVVNCDFDDSYELDVATRLLQPIKAEVLRPDSDVGPNQWTPTTGVDHWAMVDDATSDGDASTLTDATVGHKDRMGLVDLSTTPTAIYAIQAVTVARKTDAGLRQIRLNLHSGSSVANGHDQTLGVNFAAEYDVWETDPDTAAAFNASGVNNLEVELELVT